MPLKTPKLGETRCYWTLLNAGLQFLYLDPVLSIHMREQAELLIGRSLLDYVHPDERENARRDLQSVVDNKALHGSVTRVKYVRASQIRVLLGSNERETFPHARQVGWDENYIPCDIVINYCAHNLVLCFIHAIIDISPRADNNETMKSHWTNWCGTTTLNTTDATMLYNRLYRASTFAPPLTPSAPDLNPRRSTDYTPPTHIVQILSNSPSRSILFSWPTENFYPRDYARLAANVQIDPAAGPSTTSAVYPSDDINNSAASRGDDGVYEKAKTSCTRRYKSLQRIVTGGVSREVESIFIPHGGVIFACHVVVNQRPLTDAEVAVQARASSLMGQDYSYTHQLASQEVLDESYGMRVSHHPRRYSNSGDLGGVIHTYTDGGPSNPDFNGWLGSSNSGSVFASSEASSNDSWSNQHPHFSQNTSYLFNPPGPSSPPAPFPSSSSSSSPSSFLASFHTNLPNLPNMFHNVPSNQDTLLDQLKPLSSAPHAHTYPSATQVHPSSSSSQAQPTAPTIIPSTNNNSINLRSATPPPPQRVSLSSQSSATTSGGGGGGGAKGGHGHPPPGVKSCVHCGTTTSPEWRKGPTGTKNLCNACGLRYARTKQKEEGHVPTRRRGATKDKPSLREREKEKDPSPRASSPTPLGGPVNNTSVLLSSPPSASSSATPPSSTAVDDDESTLGRPPSKAIKRTADATPHSIGSAVPAFNSSGVSQDPLGPGYFEPPAIYIPNNGQSHRGGDFDPSSTSSYPPRQASTIPAIRKSPLHYLDGGGGGGGDPGPGNARSGDGSSLAFDQLGMFRPSPNTR